MVVGRLSEAYEVLLPASTGAVARSLGVTEPRLNDLIRRNKIRTPPAVIGGRRHWTREHILDAARLLGVAESSILLAMNSADGGES